MSILSTAVNGRSGPAGVAWKMGLGAPGPAIPTGAAGEGALGLAPAIMEGAAPKPKAPDVAGAGGDTPGLNAAMVAGGGAGAGAGDAPGPKAPIGPAGGGGDGPGPKAPIVPAGGGGEPKAPIVAAGGGGEGAAGGGGDGPGPKAPMAAGGGDGAGLKDAMAGGGGEAPGPKPATLVGCGAGAGVKNLLPPPITEVSPASMMGLWPMVETAAAGAAAPPR